jgi:hypothetical protein
MTIKKFHVERFNLPNRAQSGPHPRYQAGASRGAARLSTF